MTHFACPFCQARVSVELDSIGDAIVCSACTRPFRPQIPEGALVEDTKEGWRSIRPIHAPGDERTVARVRPTAFRRNPIKSAFLFVLAGVALTIGIVVAYRSDNGWLVLLTAIVCVVAAFICLGSLGIAFLETRFESLTITSQRSLWRRGIFTKSTSEVQHDDIRNIQLKQNLLDQLLKIGTISISSAGQDDMEIVVRGVPRPADIVELVRAYQRRLEKDD